MSDERLLTKYPPPWHAVRNTGRHTWAVVAFVGGPDGRDCVTVADDVPDEPTARVIAAAPELLDLLTGLRTYLQPWTGGLRRLLARYDLLVSSLADAEEPVEPPAPPAAAYVGEAPTPPPAGIDPGLIRRVYQRADDATVPTPIPFDPPRPPDGFPAGVKCGHCGGPAAYRNTDVWRNVVYLCESARCGFESVYAPDNPPRPDPLPPPVAPPPEASAIEDVPF